MSSTPITIFLAGGGTGGHLYPGIAVAEALRKRSADIRPVFLCTTREIDRTILQPTGFEFIPQPIVPPHRTVNGLLKFWTSWRETKDLIRKERRARMPAAVLGLGGYGAGVAVRYLAGKKVPAALLNPDVIPGKANQFLMKYARAVCCQFEETAERVSGNHRKKIRVTGCPIRADMANPPSWPSSVHCDCRAGRFSISPAKNTRPLFARAIEKNPSTPW
jgi:UDP-N-acetylglucosamine--N-acetylmuramyl-(pentapeptide) pyrophosphoryl-undecaprenol N-acetylglucosamine transferase